MKAIRELIVRIAKDNAGWGYDFFTVEAWTAHGLVTHYVLFVTAFQASQTLAIAAQFVGSIKRECLSKLILFGEDHLRRAIREFVEHYHEERPHQGLGNRRIRDRGEAPLVGDGEVVADERLGGLLRSYRRSA